METTTRPGTPLRHRMLDDMRMRKFAEHTQDGYIRAVRKLAAFLGRSPDTATIEDLRRFQLHLVDAGTGPVTINATITGLKFFFDITLGRPEVMAKMQHVRVPRKLPVILSPDEVGRLIAAAPNLKHQAAMSVAYGAGLRVSEVVSLKVPCPACCWLSRCAEPRLSNNTCAPKTEATSAMSQPSRCVLLMPCRLSGSTPLWRKREARTGPVVTMLKMGRRLAARRQRQHLAVMKSLA